MGNNHLLLHLHLLPLLQSHLLQYRLRQYRLLYPMNCLILFPILFQFFLLSLVYVAILPFYVVIVVFGNHSLSCPTYSTLLFHSYCSFFQLIVLLHWLLVHFATIENIRILLWMKSLKWKKKNQYHFYYRLHYHRCPCIYLIQWFQSLHRPTTTCLDPTY